MKVLLAGAAGQVGREFAERAPASVELAALGRDALDVGDGAAVDSVFADLRPDAVVNAAAYTAVDRAEEEPDAARRVNAGGAGNLARAAARHGARLVHVSTDFVFSGDSGSPRGPGDDTAPVNVYGRTKLEGERLVSACCPEGSVIVRTAWVYSRHGRNFVKSMLALMDERDELRVVCDQVGSPTWAGGLAGALWELVRRPDITGIQHWTDAGVASWYDFAVAVREEGARLGLLRRGAAVRPVGTADYPTPARRPPYSVLDKSATWRLLESRPRHWRESLILMLKELKSHAA